MKKKILLVDDDEDLLRSFQIILESKGFGVITANNGKDGFLKFKSEQPDLLVLDIMMNSDLEGYNLLHTIKKEPEFKKMPIIMLTGMRDQLGVNLYSAVEDESAFPHVRYQDKPIDPLKLAEMIGDMLQE
ncbi:MAG: response regulator [Bacteroidales bacterium]|nr:response regulator [Bacteroidales bacterium]